MGSCTSKSDVVCLRQRSKYRTPSSDQLRNMQRRQTHPHTGLQLDYESEFKSEQE